MSESHPAAQVVRRYMACSGALDAAGLVRCFFPQASLNGVLGLETVQGFADAYIADVRRMSEARADMSAYDAAMTAFEVTGAVAAATVSMRGMAGARFVDYLHLMQRDGEWRIVSNTFTTL